LTSLTVMSLTIDPSDHLVFQRPLNTYRKAVLTLENSQNYPIAFKVKTTAPKQFCVRPNAGRIEAESRIEVQVLLQPMKEEPPLDAKVKDKFLVQSISLEGESDAIHLGEFWASVDKNKKKPIHEHKLRCVYLPLKNAQTSDGEQAAQPESEETRQESPTSAHSFLAQEPASPASDPLEQSIYVPANEVNEVMSERDNSHQSKEVEHLKEVVLKMQLNLNRLEKEKQQLLSNAKLEQKATSSQEKSAPSTKPIPGSYDSQQGALERFPIILLVALFSFIVGYYFS